MQHLLLDQRGSAYYYQDLNDAKLLVEKLHRLPFPKAMSNDIIRRYNTCKLVTSCREFINSNAICRYVIIHVIHSCTQTLDIYIC